MRSKRWGYGLALLAAISLGVSGCEKREIRNVDAKGSCIVCIGDSLTFGYGAEPQDAYPRILAQLSGLPVVNSGVDGETSAGALARLDKDVLKHKPRLVIIELGGNDFLTKIPYEKTASTLREMVARIQENGAMVALVDISSGMLLQEYAPLYRKLAEETGSVFIPGVLTGIITNPSLKSDFLHPNAEGYKLMAERIYRDLESYLIP